jgi:glucokinase
MYDYDRVVAAVTSGDIRAINRTSILEMIRVAGPISRSEIAHRLQISLPTVMRITNDLMDEKMVRPANQKQWTGGRKRDLVEFNGSQHLVVGVDLGGTKFFGAVADLTGKVLYETRFEHGQSSAEESFDVLCESLSRLIEYACDTGLPVLGIAVGVPGITHPGTGVVTHAPSLGWDHFPLKARMAEKFSVPIVIENDVNLAVLGEFWFGTEPGEENVVLIAIGTGIGAGLVINGVVYTGAHQMAGEVGYLLPSRANLNEKYPGFGAFEQIASGTGIAARARVLLDGQLTPDQLDAITAEDVFVAARYNAGWAKSILNETIDYVAQAVASICLVVDPHVVLFGGGVSRSADLFIDPIAKRLEGVIPVVPKLAASNLGYQAAVLGGIARILRSAASYCTVLKYD